MERNMTTGRHIVRDIICKQCNETVGWKYDKAYEASEKCELFHVGEGTPQASGFHLVVPLADHLPTIASS